MHLSGHVKIFIQSSSSSVQLYKKLEGTLVSRHVTLKFVSQLLFDVLEWCWRETVHCIGSLVLLRLLQSESVQTEFMRVVYLSYLNKLFSDSLQMNTSYNKLMYIPVIRAWTFSLTTYCCFEFADCISSIILWACTKALSHIGSTWFEFDKIPSPSCVLISNNVTKL